MTLTIREVDQSPIPHSSSSGHPSAAFEPVDTSLQDARDLVGALLIPSFIPDGFTLRKVSVFRERDVFLTYINGPTTSGTPLFVNLVKNASQSVKTGYVQDTSVGARQAHLIRGNWEESDHGVDWNPDSSLSVAFERDGWVVMIIGFKGLDGQTLSRVGESLESSSN